MLSDISGGKLTSAYTTTADRQKMNSEKSLTPPELERFLEFFLEIGSGLNRKQPSEWSEHLIPHRFFQFATEATQKIKYKSAFIDFLLKSKAAKFCASQTQAIRITNNP
jgi:hypothetical protein